MLFSPVNRFESTMEKCYINIYYLYIYILVYLAARTCIYLIFLKIFLNKAHVVQH